MRGRETQLGVHSGEAQWGPLFLYHCKVEKNIAYSFNEIKYSHNAYLKQVSAHFI